MEKYTQRQLRSLVASGAAKDVTHSSKRDDIPESYTQIGYANGLYGCNGMLLRGYRTDECYLHFLTSNNK